VLSHRAEAQSGYLGVTSIFNLPDTIYEGTSYDSIMVFVTNKDSFPYQGVIELWMVADSSNFPVLLSAAGPAFQLNPGDSASIIINNYTFDPAAFKEGDNIVVVWPIGTFNDADSLYADVYYLHLSSVDNQYINDDIIVYPNPAGGKLHFYTTGNLLPERVRIIDSKGRLVYNEIFSPTLDVYHLAPGVYSLFIFHREGVSIKKLLTQ
jgi:hypothetical protein